MASLEAPRALKQNERQLARHLTKLLRDGKPHRLDFRPGGFVRLADCADVAGFAPLDLSLAQAIVAEDNKQRFSLREEVGGEW